MIGPRSFPKLWLALTALAVSVAALKGLVYGIEDVWVAAKMVAYIPAAMVGLLFAGYVLALVGAWIAE